MATIFPFNVAFCIFSQILTSCKSSTFCSIKQIVDEHSPVTFRQISQKHRICRQSWDNWTFQKTGYRSRLRNNSSRKNNASVICGKSFICREKEIAYNTHTHTFLFIFLLPYMMCERVSISIAGPKSCITFSLRTFLRTLQKTY